MANFRKKAGSGSQSINTASLPDIVFMLLFFFMVVTKMKDNEVKLSIKVPKASEIAKLENKQVVTYLYVGKPKQPEIFGTSTRIQLNDAFKNPNSIPVWVEEEKKRLPPKDVDKFTVSIKGDRDIRMGILTDIKLKLREANALKIVYSANIAPKLESDN
ncbi:MAG TPA: biopolymer transporter ExbD [Bacteroidia bacterium]